MRSTPVNWWTLEGALAARPGRDRHPHRSRRLAEAHGRSSQRRAAHGEASVTLGTARSAIERDPDSAFDVYVAAQMRGQDLRRQRKVAVVGGLAAFAPPSFDGRHPAGLAVADVYPSDGIDIATRSEQRGIELDLRLGDELVSTGPGFLSNQAAWVPRAGDASVSVNFRSRRRRVFSR